MQTSSTEILRAAQELFRDSPVSVAMRTYNQAEFLPEAMGMGFVILRGGRRRASLAKCQSRFVEVVTRRSRIRGLTTRRS